MDNRSSRKIKDINYYQCHRKEMLKYIPHNVKNVLDVGCATGVFGGAIKSELNAQVWGVDISPLIAEKARLILDNVVVGDFESDKIKLPHNYFDCIIFNDSLEHFEDPWSALKRCDEYLKLNGFIVASIPNVRFIYNIKALLIDKNWKYSEGGILDRTHLRFFTENSIKDTFNNCGYSIVKLEGLNPADLSWKFWVFNLLTLKMFEDFRFQQFVCVAQKS